MAALSGVLTSVPTSWYRIGAQVGLAGKQTFTGHKTTGPGPSARNTSYHRFARNNEYLADSDTGIDTANLVPMVYQNYNLHSP